MQLHTRFNLFDLYLRLRIPFFSKEDIKGENNPTIYDLSTL